MALPAPRRSRLPRAAGLAALVALAAASTHGASAGGTPPAPGAAKPGYLGAASCAPCHEKAYADWVGSMHARSTREVHPDDMPAGALAGRPVAHGPGSTAFRAEGARVLARTPDADGAQRDFPVLYAVGGRRVTMQVTRLADGRHQVLPGMRDEVRGRWFDYTALVFGAPGLPHERAPVVKPGDPTFWTGPVRSYEGRCARCHVGDAVDLSKGSAAGTSGPDALGPDCESCHGPGEPHVLHWRATPTPPGPDPIARLGALPPDRLQDTCLRCHMEGEVVGPWSIGDDILEHVDPTLLDDGDRVDASGRPIELLYEGLQLSVSRCAAGGRLRCTSCHEVHGGRRRALLVKEITSAALCVDCHPKESKDPRAHGHHDPLQPGGSCFACHLPPLMVERGNGHVTDHTIGVPVPTPEGAVEGRTTDACTGCHTGARGYPAGMPRMPQERLVESYDAWWPGARRPRPAWSSAIAAGRTAGAPGAAAGLASLLEDRSAPLLVRASAARLIGRHGASTLEPLAKALKDPASVVRRSAAYSLEWHEGPRADALLLEALADPSPPVRLRAARAAIGGYERARANPALLKALLPVLEEDAAAWPLDDQRWFRLGAARELAGDLPGAIAAYERQTALDPFATTVRAYLETLRAKVPGPGKR